MPLTPAERALRKTGITATDAAALTGEHPFRSVHDVYAEKVAENDTGDDPLAKNVRVMLGHAAEPVIMKLLAEERGLVLRAATTEPHPIWPWVLATPDRDVVEVGKLATAETRVAVAEAKLVGRFATPHWYDEDGDLVVPMHVHAQVQWQMVQRRVRVGYVAVLLDDNDFKSFVVEHDEDLAGALLEVCDRFYRVHVAARVPPPPDASEACTRALVSHYASRIRKPELLAASPDVVAWARKYIEASAAAKVALDAKAHAGNELRALIGDHEGALGGGVKITWKDNESGTPAWKEIAMAAGASADLIREHTPKGARVLRVTEPKEKTNERRRTANAA